MHAEKPITNNNIIAMETKNTRHEKANYQLNMLQVWMERYMRGGSTLTNQDILSKACYIIFNYEDERDEALRDALKRVSDFTFNDDVKDWDEWEKMAKIEIDELNNFLINYN